MGLNVFRNDVSVQCLEFFRVASPSVNFKILCFRNQAITPRRTLDKRRGTDPTFGSNFSQPLKFVSQQKTKKCLTREKENSVKLRDLEERNQEI